MSIDLPKFFIGCAVWSIRGCYRLLIQSMVHEVRMGYDHDGIITTWYLLEPRAIDARLDYWYREDELYRFYDDAIRAKEAMEAS